AGGIRRLEAESIADLERRGDVDEQLAALVPRHGADDEPSVVRLRARDVVAAGPAAIHAAGESTAVDLNERLDFAFAGRRGVAALQPIERVAIRLRDGRHVLGA